MPEIYTHERLARMALPKIPPALEPAVYEQPASYFLGANGPDLLFFHYIWQGGNRYQLLKLGGRLHQVHTAQLLCALLTRARTPSQRAYALGFLCHYALDSSVHPYVYAQTAPGGLFAGGGGHGQLELAIDSAYFTLDHLDADGIEVPPDMVSPYGLEGVARRQIAAQLSVAIGEAYDLAIPPEQFLQAMRHMEVVKQFLFRPSPAKRLVLRAAEAVIRRPGEVVSHIYAPVFPDCDFMNTTHQPWYGLDAPEVARHESVDELFQRGLRRAEAYANAAPDFMAGRMNTEQFSNLLGRCSYSSDIPGSGR